MAGASSYLPDRYQGIDRESYAYKMLASMGWQEGDGLGAQRQGIRTHIRTKKKFDNSGVGQVESARQAQDWTSDMVNFSAVLGSLKEVVARRVDAVDSSDDDDGDDAEPAAAHRKPAAAPAAESTQRGERHAAALAKGSSKRKRSATAETAADASTPTVAAAASSAAAAPPAPVAEKRATHSGRYAKRARNKMVKGYSATDLAAILGGTTGATGAQRNGAGAPSSQVTAVVSAAASVLVESTPTEAARDRAQARAQVPSECSSDTAEPGPEDGTAWWRVLFLRGGKVGSSEQEVSRARSMFSEQDQTDLYNKAQGSKSQGRVGLGQSQQPKKIAGARWQGTKTKLSEDSDDEAPEQAAEPVQGGDTEAPNCQRASDLLPGGATIVWGTAQRPRWFVSMQTADEQGGGHETTPALDGVLTAAEEKACRKAARKCLRKAGGSCKFKALQQCALDAVQAVRGGSEDAEARRKLVKRCLRQCEAWSIRKGVATAL